MKQISAPHTVNFIWRDERVVEQQEELLLEYSLEIVVDGNLMLQCACTPTDIESLVVGRLYAEGKIETIGDVATCQVQEEARRVEVALRKNRTVQTVVQKEKFLWQPEWIFKLAEQFNADTVIHQRTSCTQSCLLAQQDRILYAAEDISRHNAIDKAIGWGLRQGVDLKDCILYTSGRVPVDMMQKVVHAGIPLIISNTAPTKDAVLLAEQNGVTLIGGVKKDRLKVYTNCGKKNTTK